MKARRTYVRGKVIFCLLFLLMLVAVYGCARDQEESSLSQTQDKSRVTEEQVSQPDSKLGESNRVKTKLQQTSEDHPQEVNTVSSLTIEEVKADWEERLMAMPGVMGVGIGLTQDRQQTCIKIYVNRQTSAQVDQIPQEIEGYPVEVEIRKPFRAL